MPSPPEAVDKLHARSRISTLLAKRESYQNWIELLQGTLDMLRAPARLWDRPGDPRLVRPGPERILRASSRSTLRSRSAKACHVSRVVSCWAAARSNELPYALAQEQLSQLQTTSRPTGMVKITAAAPPGRMLQVIALA